MKTVSFEIAKILKEAGYPQDRSSNCYNACTGEFHYTSCSDSWLKDGDYIDAPTYLEVWLWLWREKGIKISHRTGVDITGIEDNDAIDDSFEDPEEAIIAAIEYLVNNNEYIFNNF